mmetsp:Transcript_19394/g.39059  ORF Transcript_19394/g.39059 Transcript_19394/m.39059 type:complete len:95 (-) Transcript_19394:26-310(-)
MSRACIFFFSLSFLQGLFYFSKKQNELQRRNQIDREKQLSSWRLQGPCANCRLSLTVSPCARSKGGLDAFITEQRNSIRTRVEDHRTVPACAKE